MSGEFGEHPGEAALPPTASECRVDAAGHSDRSSALLAQSFTALLAGLLDDVIQLIISERRGEAVDWAVMAVVGAFPVRFRDEYTPRLVVGLFSSAAVLLRQFQRGPIMPESLADFLLLGWLLDDARHWGAPNLGPRCPSRLELAHRLGLGPDDEADSSLVGDSASVGTEWTMNSISVEPAQWFDPMIRPVT